MTDEPHTKKCPVCNGRGYFHCNVRGYFHCDCWPGDCICGQDYEACEECGGEGWIDASYDNYYENDYRDKE